MISAQVSQLSVENIVLLLAQAITSRSCGFPEGSGGWIPSYPEVLKESGARLPRAGSLSAATFANRVYIAFTGVFYLEISNASLNKYLCTQKNAVMCSSL